MNKVGNLLKEKREELGYTLGEVELKTRIQRIYLEAIEEGNFDLFGTKSFYQNVFTGNYAIFLGLDKNEVLTVLDEDKDDYAKIVLERQLKAEEAKAEAVVEEAVVEETIEQPTIEEEVVETYEETYEDVEIPSEDLLSSASIFDEIQKIAEENTEVEVEEVVGEIEPIIDEDINSIMEDLLAIRDEEEAIETDETDELAETIEVELEEAEETEEMAAINNILDDLIDENKSEFDDVLISEMDNSTATDSDAIDLEVAQLQEQITASISLEDIQNQYPDSDELTSEIENAKNMAPVDEKTAIDLKIAKALGDVNTSTTEELKKVKRSKIIDTILVVAIIILFIVLAYLVAKSLKFI